MARAYHAPYKELINANLAVNTTGAKTNIDYRDRVFYNVEWSGGAGLNANFSVEYSLDDETWYTLDFGATIAMTGASGLHQIIITESTFLYLRPVITFVAGSADFIIAVKSAAQGV